MNIQPGDKFNYTAPDGNTATVQVTDTIGNKVSFKHIHGRTAKDSVHTGTFAQLVQSGYFTRTD